MVAPAHIKLYLDNAYAEHMIQKGDASENAHKDLWDKFYQAAATMKSMEVERTNRHEYTDMILKRINAGGYPVIERSEQDV